MSFALAALFREDMSPVRLLSFEAAIGWVISFNHHPYVTYAREVYLRRIAVERSQEEADLRMAISEILSVRTDIERRIVRSAGYRSRAKHPRPIERFRRGLERFEVRGICLNQLAPLASEVRAVILEEGFARKEIIQGYEIWTRPQAATSR